MKRFILSVCAATIAFASVNAQDLTTEVVPINSRLGKLSKFRFGLFVAPGMSSLKPASAIATGGNAEKYDVSKGKGKFSFGFGLNAEKPLTNKYAIVTGIGLDWQGGNIVSAKTSGADSNYVSSDIKYKLKYIQIPLGLKLKATNIQKFQIYGQIGLDASIAIGNKVDGNIDGSAISGISLKRTVTPVNIGMDLGIGTEFKVSSDNSAYVAVMYRNGFTDATIPALRSTADLRWQDGNVRANNISLRIGYFF